VPGTAGPVWLRFVLGGVTTRDGTATTLSNHQQQNEGKNMINHNRTYSAALAVLGVLAIVSSGLLLFLAGASAGGAVDSHLPEWSLPWVALINFAYAIAIIVTLCARRFRPETGRVLTRLLNWALLPALPGGTVVGIYGLLSADKERASNHAA
jgi:hypothetical protein